MFVPARLARALARCQRPRYVVTIGRLGLEMESNKSSNDANVSSRNELDVDLSTSNIRNGTLDSKRCFQDKAVKRFIIIGGFPQIRKELLDRGWVEQDDPNSLCFDLKWTLKTSEIDFSKLQPHQIVNHYEKNRNITTKIGLSNSLRNLKWCDDIDCNAFFPRCYDLNNMDQVLSFVEDFMLVAALGVLRPFAAGQEELSPRVWLALHACEAWLHTLTSMADDDEADGNTTESEDEVGESPAIPSDSPLVAGWGLSASEWELILGEKLPEPINVPDIAGGSCRRRRRGRPAHCAAHGGPPAAAGDCPAAACPACAGGAGEPRARVARAVAAVDGGGGARGAAREGPLQGLDGGGGGGGGVWIVKPAGKSRGRGITAHRALGRLAGFFTDRLPHQAER
jgi:hypothetical protein